MRMPFDLNIFRKPLAAVLAVIGVSIIGIVVMAAVASPPPQPAMSLEQAVREGNTEQVKAALYWAKDRQAAVRPLDGSGMTSLHLAAEKGHVEVAAALLDARCPVNAQTSDGTTPLHLAAAGGHKTLAALLLSRGADVSIKNKKGRTPADVASANRRTETTKLLSDNTPTKE